MAQGENVVIGIAVVLDHFHAAVGIHTAAGHEMYREEKRDHLHAGNTNGAQSVQAGRVFGDRFRQVRPRHQRLRGARPVHARDTQDSWRAPEVCGRPVPVGREVRIQLQRETAL